MTLQEIKKALANGQTVNWQTELYEVTSGKNDMGIRCQNGSFVGLHIPTYFPDGEDVSNPEFSTKQVKETVTKENRFSSLWKRLNPDEYKEFEKLLASHNLPLDHALSFTRARLVVACGFPLGMGAGKVFWHANYLTRDHGRKLRAFMKSHKDLAPFIA